MSKGGGTKQICYDTDDKEDDTSLSDFGHVIIAAKGWETTRYYIVRWSISCNLHVPEGVQAAAIQLIPSGADFTQRSVCPLLLMTFEREEQH
jgi:hypothetical protein